MIAVRLLFVLLVFASLVYEFLNLGMKSALSLLFFQLHAALLLRFFLLIAKVECLPSNFHFINTLPGPLYIFLVLTNINRGIDNEGDPSERRDSPDPECRCLASAIP